MRINQRKNIKTYRDTTYKFNEYFDLNSGFYLRTDSEETGKDSFMRSFPALLDIGIMGGCKSCRLCRTDCYQGGRDYNPEKNMIFEDYKRIIEEGADKGLQQVALGGAGNPNDHRDFEEIVRFTRSKDIIPNYTTSGIELSDSAVRATKEYCGAVAVSWYYQEFTVNALNKFLESEMKTSIHFVLSKDSIEDAIRCLETGRLAYSGDKEFDLNESGINAIIFLLYKPVGLGRRDRILTIKDNESQLKRFFEAIKNNRNKFKIGFDSCSIPGIINYSDSIDRASIDTCEGGRFSAYINSDLMMTPCSFDQNLEYGISLRDSSVEEVWNSDKFSKFRSKLFFSCLSCKNRENCLGGCPLNQEIVLCNSVERITNLKIG